MPSIVQTAAQDGNPTITLAMPGDVTSGNLLLLFISGTPEFSSTPSITDTRGLTYTSVAYGGNPNGAQSACQIIIAPITSSGPQTIVNTVGVFSTMRAVEISGVGSPVLDDSSSGLSDHVSSVSTGSVTSAHSMLMLLGVAADDASGTDFNSTSPSGGTQYFSTFFQACYIEFTGAGTYSFTAGKTGNGNRSSAAVALVSFTTPPPPSTDQPIVFVIT